MSKLYRSLLWSGLVAAGVAACGDQVVLPPPAPPPTPSVHSVSVAPTGIVIPHPTTLPMTASINADAGVATTVTWSAAPNTVATINATTGVLTTVGAGAVAVQACSTVNTAVCGNATITVSTAATSTVTSVLVSPGNPSIVRTTPANTLQLTAAVVGTNAPSQIVTWQASPNPAIATVSATGLITVPVASTGGVVVLTACSTVTGFTNVCGSSSVNVIIPSPATISIQSVTWVPAPGAPGNCTPGPGPAVPVVLTNVGCQIEVTANVNAGDVTLTRIDVLIGGQVVASQTFPGTVAADGENAAVSAPVDIVMSVNTRQVKSGSTTGGSCNGFVCIPVVFNGNQQITVNLYTANSATPLASNAIPVVMNNADAIVYPKALVTTVTTPAAVCATNGGVLFCTGTQTITGGEYIAFSKVAPTTFTWTGTLCGGSTTAVNGTPTTGLQYNGVFSCIGVEGQNTITNAAMPTIVYPVATGPDGTPITPPAFFSSLGTGFSVPVNAAGTTELRWNLLLQNGAPVPLPTQLTLIGVDNKGPTVSLNTVAFNANWDQPWINSNTQSLLPFINASDAGSGMATVSPKAARIFAVLCPGPDLPDPATTTNLPETVTSTATDGKRICGRATDAVGNVSVTGASNFFGVDVVAPSARYAGSTAATPALVTPANTTVSTLANTTIFGIAANAAFGVNGPFPAADKWGIEGLDTRSGFNQNGTSLGAPGPAIQKYTMMNPANPGSVLAPDGATCPIASPSLGTILSDTWVRSTTTPAIDGTTAPCTLGQTGYFRYTPTVVDRAGNVGTPTVASRNYAIDQYAAPNITGLGFVGSTGAGLGVYTPGITAIQPGGAQFGFSANDDLEIIDGSLALTQAIPSGGGTALRYPLGTLTPIGTRWDNGLNSLTNVVNGAVASVRDFIFRVDETCSAAATPYAGCPAPGGPPAYITAPKTAVTANYGTGLSKLPTAASASVGDVAWQSSGNITAPMLASQFSPAAGIAEPWTAADIVSWDAVTSGGSFIATHVASTSIVVPFFDNVYLYRFNTANEWVWCGSASTGTSAGTFPAPTLTDNGFNRFWTYTITKPTTGPCIGPIASFTGAAPIGQWRAGGTKSGALLMTPTRP